MAFLVFLLALLGALVLLVAIGYVLAPKKPSDVKYRRFEAGGPPFGEAKRRLLMQYIGYIYLVTAVEALVGLMIVAYLSKPAALEFAVYLAVALVLVAAFVARHIKTLTDVRKWS
jgi:NADH-quinone oxidoreductase subunit A